MAAALLMSATRSLFRMAAEGLESPSQVLMRLNQALLKDLPEGRFVTLVYLILDTKRATVRVANGGHPYPIFVRDQTSTTELKTEKGLPLGLMNSEYSDRVDLTDWRPRADVHGWCGRGGERWRRGIWNFAPCEILAETSCISPVGVDRGARVRQWRHAQR